MRALRGGMGKGVSSCWWDRVEEWGFRIKPVFRRDRREIDQALADGEKPLNETVEIKIAEAVGTSLKRSVNERWAQSEQIHFFARAVFPGCP